MNIEFIPSSKEVELSVPPPIPAKNFIPDWYKKTNNINKNKINFDKENKINLNSVKMCMPFLDSFTSGYIQSTWCDIYIDFNNNSVSYYYSGQPQILSSRENISIEISKDFYPIEFIWKQPWIIKTPKNYSVLITNPFNRFDLNTFTFSGIVDSDKFNHIPFGNVPFFIKNNFLGIIPAGTPMFQIVPIKREKWESNINKYNEDILLRKKNFMFKNFFGVYKNNFWNKKNYS